MKRKAGDGGCNCRKNEPRLGAGDVRGPFRVHGNVLIEIRLDALQVALNRMPDALRQLDLTERKKHFSVAAKETAAPRLHYFSGELAAFRNQQFMIRGEHGPGHLRLHRRSLFSGRRADPGQQAGAHFPRLGIGNRGWIGWRFDRTRRQPGQGLL